VTVWGVQTREPSTTRAAITVALQNEAENFGNIVVMEIIKQHRCRPPSGIETNSDRPPHPPPSERGARCRQERSASPTVLGNISTRLRVETGQNVMNGGFIVTGNDLKKVILRAIGPSLAGFGIVDPLADPVLELHGSDGSLITTNDNWKAAQQSEIEATGLQPENDLEAAIVIGPSLTPFGVADALADPTLELHNANGDLAGSNDNWKSLQQTEIEATGLAPQEDAESGLMAELAPGSYTVIVAGKDGSVGVGLVEVYALQ
jgi:hypothetical protein